MSATLSAISSHAHAVGRAVEGSGHLPHLGVDEQERGEQQQQRQCARDEWSEPRELPAGSANTPSQECADTVRRPDVDQQQQSDAEGQCLGRIAVLAECQAREHGSDQEECELGRPDLRRSCECGPTAEAVGDCPGGHEHDDDRRSCSEVLGERPVTDVERVESEDDVGSDEKWQRPGPGVEQDAVGMRIHEVWNPTFDQPAFDVRHLIVWPGGDGWRAIGGHRPERNWCG